MDRGGPAGAPSQPTTDFGNAGLVLHACLRTAVAPQLTAAPRTRPQPCPAPAVPVAAPPPAGPARAPSVVPGPTAAQFLRITEYVAMLVLALIAIAAAGAPLGFAELPAVLVAPMTTLQVLGAAGVAALWSAAAALCGLYDPEARATQRARVLALLVCSAVAAAVVAAFATAGPLASLVVWMPHTLLAFAAVYGLRAAVAWGFARGVGERNVLIVGTGPAALRLRDRLTLRSDAAFRLLGFVDSECHGDDPHVREHLLCGLDGLEQLLVESAVDEVLIALPVKSRYAEIQAVIRSCERIGVQVTYPADIFDSGRGVPRYEAGHPVARVAIKMVRDDGRWIVKRAIDVAGSAVGLIVLAPLLAAIALAIRLTSPGPVIFTQLRYGYNRRRFRMLKFRTMVVGAETAQQLLEARNEATGPVFKIRDDPRITPVGRFLRRTSLDELPQLINVLRGEMSLVGPRPLPLRDVARFPESWLMRRFSVYPGITGLWQVGGRSELPFDDWIRLDLRYIDGWSLGLDLQILARTIPAVIRGTGAT